ncbi:MAG: site-2 protease family protein [Ruminococcaceae bacterium]|nr:site-2 protease family protein [Oscillospiraceae bacterium]
MFQYIRNLFQELNIDFLLSTLQRLLAVVLCLTVHETAHGFAAYLLGDRTAKQEGRLSLNPLRHVDLVGLALLFTAGFGWAKPVPVDPRHFRNPKRGMAVTALAGPASNFLLAILLLLICKAIYIYNDPGSFLITVFYTLLYAVQLSIGLGLFNLLPIPPLDGSKILAAFLPDRAYYTLMRYERYGMILLLVLSLANVTGDFISDGISSVYTALINLILLG